MTEQGVTPETPTATPTLDYGLPPPRRSPVPLLGVIACAGGVVCALGLIGFGFWWMYYAVAGGAGERLDLLGRGVDVVVTGGLVGWLFARWLVAAWRARRRVA